MFSEAGEGLSPYGIGNHRHVPEIEQELGLASGASVTVNFTPHLAPMSRGELCTCYVRMTGKARAADLRKALGSAYADSPFVHVVGEGVSMAVTQRSEFASVVQRNGGQVRGLLAMMRDKTANAAR